MAELHAEADALPSTRYQLTSCHMLVHAPQKCLGEFGNAPVIHLQSCRTLGGRHVYSTGHVAHY